METGIVRVGLLSLLLAGLFTVYGKSVNVKYPPVILVPGDGGSQIFAKLDKPKTIHYLCSQKTADYFELWLNLELMAPYVLDCFVDNMRLTYNRTTRRTSNSPGVETKIPGWGNTTSVEWLDESQISVSSYFGPIVESIVHFFGYQRGINVRGAPYDFRKAPNEVPELFTNLKKLVEDTYYSNGNEAVVFIAHSMGNVMLLYFFNHIDQAWKDKFVSSFISLSGPWGGAAKTLRLQASGDNLGIYVVNPLTIRPEQRSMSSSAFLMPYDTFWGPDEILVTAPKGNYTVKDYKRFFTDIKFMDGWFMRQDTEHLIKDLTPPGVTVHCLHGVNVDTPAKFHYTTSTWPSQQPKVEYDLGDGTVNIRSLLGCLRWRKNQTQPVFHETFDNIDHMGILESAGVMTYIRKVLLKGQS